MKIRNGFVSNSSSSSFICVVCGDIQCSYDSTLEESEMYECENDHIFCRCHIIGEYDNEDIDDYSVPEVNCPICQFKNMSDNDYIRYLEVIGLSKDKIFTEIKSKFKTYKKFKDFLEKH